MACRGVIRLVQLAALAAASSQSCSKDTCATSLLQTRLDLDIQTNRAAGPTKICIDGYAVPQFYLLGAQKAGTTTLGYDLLSIGMNSASKISIVKEIHAFDGEYMSKRDEWHAAACGVGDEANMSAVIRATSAITLPDATISAAELSKMLRCSDASEDATLADMTPENLRLPSGPRMFADLYGVAKKDLRFAIALREPMTRFHSGFYQEHFWPRKQPALSACGNWSFADYVEKVIPLARASASIGFEELEHDVFLDQLYRSMYSFNIEPWLKAFQPSQFVIIPMGAYFEGIPARQATMETLRDRLGVTVDPQNVGTLDQIDLFSNTREHADLVHDLDNASVAVLNEEFFGPDTKRLAEMLATALAEGLVIDGYKGKAEAASIEEFLRLKW